MARGGGRALRPLFIIATGTAAAPTNLVGTDAIEVEVRGRDHDGNIVSGQAEELTVTCLHGTQKLYISFDGTHFLLVGTNGASKTYNVSCRKFWLKGEAADTTFEVHAGIL